MSARPLPAAWEGYARQLGERIRRARGRAGLSQQALADRTGMARETLQRYEAGHDRAGQPAHHSLLLVLAIAEAVGCSPSELIGSPVGTLLDGA